MGLGYDSDLFAAGVDISGVHTAKGPGIFGRYSNSYEKPADLSEMLETFWKAAPVSAVATWKSPVLFIHGDDDRNVPFSETVDLVRRLEDQTDVKFEVLVLPNETHHLMLHANAVKVGESTAGFFEKTLQPANGAKP